MKLTEITDDSTGQLTIDIIRNALAKGKSVWLDIDGDQGWEGIVGKVESMRVTSTGVSFRTEDDEWWDGLSLYGFDEKFTLETRKGDLHLVKIESRR